MVPTAEVEDQLVAGLSEGVKLMTSSIVMLIQAIASSSSYTSVPQKSTNPKMVLRIANPSMV